MYIRIKGLKINCKILGHGKRSIVLLHGWGGTSESLKALAMNLACVEQSKSYSWKSILVDLPGFGKSDNPNRPFSLEDYAGIVEGIVRELDLGKISFFGHSFGGAVAVKVVVRGNVEVEKLILCNASGICRQPATSLKWPAFAKKLYSLPLVGSIFLRLRKIFYYYVLKNRDYIDYPYLQETYKKVVAEDVSPLLKDILVPTLLIWGQKDKDTPLEYGKIMDAEISDSKLEVVEGATHGLPIFKPDVVAEIINNMK